MQTFLVEDDWNRIYLMQSPVSWFAVLEDCSVGSFEWLLLHSLHISLTGCNLPVKVHSFFFLNFPSGTPLSISFPSDPRYLVAKWAGLQTIFFFLLWLAYLLILSGKLHLSTQLRSCAAVLLFCHDSEPLPSPSHTLYHFWTHHFWLQLVEADNLD